MPHPFWLATHKHNHVSKFPSFATKYDMDLFKRLNRRPLSVRSVH